MQHEDLMKAKACIKREQESCKTLCEKFDILKRISASLGTKNGTHRIGKDIIDIIELGHKKRWDTQKENVEQVRTTYAKRITNADAVVTKKGGFCHAWTCADLKHFLMTSKVKSDGNMLSKRPVLVNLYKEINNEGCQRVAFHFVTETAVVDAEDCDDKEKDVEVGMVEHV